MASAVHASSQLHTGGAVGSGVTPPSGSSAPGAVYLQQLSTDAPSAPQTGQLTFMASAVQASPQMHTDASAFSSANAAAGNKDSTIQNATAKLNNLFFMWFPPFVPQLRRGQ